MIKVIFIAVSTLLLSKFSNAQVDPVGQFNKYVLQNWKDEYVRIGQYKVKGTPFLFGESFPGTLTFRGGIKSNTKILYDLYNQKVGADFENRILEAEQLLEEFSIILPEKFGGQTLLFKRTDAYGNLSLKSYFNVLAEGRKAALLKIYKIKLVSDPSNMMDKEQKIFEQYYEYYLHNPETKDLSKIKLKEKEIIKQLGNELLIKDLITKEKLDLTREADVIRLIQDYNMN